MTREQIEKEARDYISDVYAGDGYFLPAYEEEVRDEFVDGAQWRINSVWHDSNEKPNGMFVILIDFGTEISPEEFGLGLTADDLDGAKRWAYIDDLLPDGKEETE